MTASVAAAAELVRGPDYYFWEGIDLRTAFDWVGAIKQYNRALAMDPERYEIVLQV